MSVRAAHGARALAARTGRRRLQRRRRGARARCAAGRDAQPARARHDADRHDGRQAARAAGRRSRRDRRELDVERDVRSAQAARRVLHRQQSAPQSEVRRRRRARHPGARARRVRRFPRRNVHLVDAKSTTSRSTSTTRSPKRSVCSASFAKSCATACTSRSRPTSRPGWERGPRPSSPYSTCSELVRAARDLGFARADGRAHRCRRRCAISWPKRAGRRVPTTSTGSPTLGVSASAAFPVLWEHVAPDAPARRDFREPQAGSTRLRARGVEPIVTLLHHGIGSAVHRSARSRLSRSVRRLRRGGGAGVAVACGAGRRSTSR